MKPPVCLVCNEGLVSPLCEAILYPGKLATLQRCEACLSTYFWPVPSPDDIARCYPHAYFRDFFNQYWKDFYKGRLMGQYLKEWRSAGRFLDVGCALGTFLAGVREGSGWEVKGLEYMPDAARVGRELHGIEIASGGLSSAPWPDDSFDYVHGNNVLEHESAPLAALEAAHRLLRSGGRLRLVLPNGRMDVLANERLSRNGGTPVITRHSGHLFFYSKRGLEKLLGRAGFRLLSIETFHFKTALKARGLTPGADRQFQRSPEALVSAAVTAEKPLTADEMRSLIPPAPYWSAYVLNSRWKRLWRLGRCEWGYDFDLLAEKR